MVEREGKQVSVPIQDLTLEEIESKIEEFNKFGAGYFGHADELTRYKNERRASA